MESLELQAHEQWLRDKTNCVSLSKLAANGVEAPPPLFEGFLLHKTVTMLSAEPFVGKTLLMLAMAISLNTGRPLFGKHNPEALRRVLFIGQDAPTWDYVRQARKLLRGYEIDAANYGELETDLILNENVRITDNNFIENWLRPWHDATAFDVLMLDTLISVHSADENDNRQMSAVMSILKTIRDQFHCAVIFSHHLSKPQGDSPISANYRARGATAIAGGVDFHFQLHQGDSGQVNLLFPKGRGADGMEPPPYFTIVASGDAEDTRALTLVAPDENPRRARLVSLLREPRTNKDLIQLILLAEPNLGKERAAKWVDNELQALKRAGVAESVSRGIWHLLRGEV